MKIKFWKARSFGKNDEAIILNNANEYSLVGIFQTRHVEVVIQTQQEVNKFLLFCWYKTDLPDSLIRFLTNMGLK